MGQSESNQPKRVLQQPCGQHNLNCKAQVDTLCFSSWAEHSSPRGHSPSLHTFGKGIGPPLQHWSTRNGSRFLSRDFIKQKSVRAPYHSASTSTWKYCLKCSAAAFARRFQPAQAAQQQESPSEIFLLFHWPWRFSCVKWGLAKGLRKIFTAAGRGGLSQTVPCGHWESRVPSDCEAVGGAQVTVVTGERHPGWSSQSLYNYFQQNRSL